MHLIKKNPLQTAQANPHFLHKSKVGAMFKGRVLAIIAVVTFIHVSGDAAGKMFHSMKVKYAPISLLFLRVELDVID